jgi:outer membrane protein assembly factor BamB
MKLHPALYSVLGVTLLLRPTARAEDWRRFRGPNGSGVSTDTGFPTEFGSGRNVNWRRPVRPGKSSPILTDTRVFLTAFAEGKLFTQCFDRADGRLLWERAETRPRAEVANARNEPASITPVTDGENVYVFFKDLGLLSYDAAGNLRWKVPLGPFTNSQGMAASPILAGDLVVLLADQEEGSFIAGFDRGSGELRWKTPRNEGDGWATPLLHGSQVLTASRSQFGAHLLANGKRTWSENSLSPAIVASPVLWKDTFFVFGYGHDSPTPFTTPLARYDKNHDGQLTFEEYSNDPLILSIARFGGNRDLVVTKEEWDEKQRKVVAPSSLVAIKLERNGPRELWRYEKSFVGVVPSPLLYDGVLYIVRNGGILTAFDAETGAVVKMERIPGALGGYSASPVAADGRIFLASEEGKVVVLRAGRAWEVLAMNDLGEACYATPALSGGRIYLRSSEALYCFRNRPPGALSR